MQRNPFNSNQVLFNDTAFNGMSIQNDKGPLINDYLNKAYYCLTNAIDQYRSVFMLRFDLHLPDSYPEHLTFDNSLIEKFFASLKAKIKHSQAIKRSDGIRVHDTNLRYIWCRERSTRGRVHYHVAILLNHDAFAYIGQFNLANENIYARLHGAWASALSIYIDDTKGLIHIPQNPTYRIDRNDRTSLEQAFHRISYFTKIDSKDFNSGHHSFGSSRI